MTGFAGRPSATNAPGRLRVVALLAAFGVSLPLLLGFLGRWHPALDFFSHLRMHLAVLLGLTALLLLAARFLKLGALAIAAAALAFATTSGAVPGLGSNMARCMPPNRGVLFTVWCSSTCATITPSRRSCCR